jgi:OOP family OmpA-OmpF porin
MKVHANARLLRMLASALLCAAGISLFAPAAAADEEAHFYTFLNVGNADTDYRTIVDAVSDDDRSFELGVGYAFNRYWAMQGSYHDFGEPAGFVAQCSPDVVCIASTIIGGFPEQVSFDGWSVALRGTLPVSEHFALFGKLGVVAWDAQSAHLSDSGEDLVYGAGVIWNVTGPWGVQFTLEELDLDIQTVSLGVIYRF